MKQLIFPVTVVIVLYVLAPVAAKLSVFIDDVHYLRQVVQQREPEWRGIGQGVNNSLQSIVDRLRVFVREGRTHAGNVSAGPANGNAGGGGRSDMGNRQSPGAPAGTNVR